MATSAWAPAGAHIVLFATGRVTPCASPVPTVEFSSNSKLAGQRDNWIDFIAGRMVEDMTKEELAEELWSEMEKKGLVSLVKGSYVPVSLAMARKQELYACLNRYRGFH